MSRNDPIQNFRFLVEIPDTNQSSFNEVLMPEAMIDVIEYREGNEPIHVRKLSGLTRYSNIVLKWGITENMALYNWIKSGMENGASASRRAMSILLLDETGKEKVRWNFFEAWPVRYKVSDLNAQTSEVVFEMIEIAFERFERVN